MSNTLNAYPTDLMTPCQILLTRFGPTPAAANEQIHACYQILGVAASNLYPDGVLPIKDIWDRPDGMKSTNPYYAQDCPSEADFKAALEDACKMHGSWQDWLKTPAAKALIQVVLTTLTTLLLS